MYKLTKYLKPFIGLILVSIVFLFGQAMADLALPDYMSKIVNTGIQNGGIESAVPEAIRESQMGKTLIFMSEEDRNEVLDSYTLIDKSSTDFQKYVKKYPTLENEPVYVLKKKADIDKLNTKMGKALIAVSMMEKVMEEGTGGQNMMGEQPNDMRSAFEAMGDSAIVQYAANVIKAEYEALGMNVEKVQSGFIINIGIRMLLISLFSALCVVFVGLFAARVGAGLARNLRRDVFTKVESFSNAEMDKFSTSSLITRTTNDINHVQMLVMMMIRMVFYSLIMAIGGVIKAIGKSQSMTWVIVVGVIAILGLILTVLVSALPKFKLIQKLVDIVNSFQHSLSKIVFLVAIS